jgi:C4-dicarboxylate transporter DctQ subunit
MRPILHWIERSELLVACACLLMAAVGLCADVISRELLGNGLYGVQKFAVYCCAVSGALGISVVVHKGGHLRISGIDALYAEANLKRVSRLGDAVSGGICLMFAWFSGRFVLDTYNFNEMDTILNVPIWRIQIALPIAFSLAGLKYLAHALAPSLKPEEGLY